MKIIVLEDIKGLGKKFEVKEVKDGYAKNFLIPKNLVKAATEDNLKIIAKQKAAWERQEKEIIEHFKKIAIQLESVILDFSLKVGQSAKSGDSLSVFGSVSALEIEKALKGLDVFQKFEETLRQAQGKIQKVEVLLEKPIKELGEHFVEIDLGKGIKSKIKIKVHSQS